jgi:hypothetical protein
MATRLTTEAQSDVPGNGREAEGSAQGRAATSPNGVHDGQATSPATQRAEEMVDHMAERIGHFAGVLGHKLLWLVARAREEAEDIWAEAQSLRRQKTDNASEPGATSQASAEAQPVSADKPR